MTPVPRTLSHPLHVVGPLSSPCMYSLLHQPPPPTFLSSPQLHSAAPLCSPQPSAALASCRSRSWHIHRVWHPLCVSTAQGRLHLPPCFCNNTVLTHLQVYLHGSLLHKGEAGGRHGSMKGLSWHCWVWQKRKMNADGSCSFSLSQKFAAPSSCSSTPHHSDPSPMGAAGLGCFHLLQSSFYFLHPPVPATIREEEWWACRILSSRPGKRPFHLCPAALPPAFCILHLKETHFAAPLFKGWQLRLQQFQKVNSLRMGWRPRSQKGYYTAGSPVR